jgi:hypothetical protein
VSDPPKQIDPPKRAEPRPIGVVVPIEPRIQSKRHFDQPDDTAALPDLNTNDHVILTGRIRILKLGSINGKGSLDASGLAAEEIIMSGDMYGPGSLAINAPNGTVTIRGHIAGNAKVDIAAAGGTVVLTRSGRFTGGSIIAITAKRLEAVGLLTGGTAVQIKLTPGGSLKLTRSEEGATVTYSKSMPGDPPPTIEKGELHGGAKVLSE